MTDLPAEAQAVIEDVLSLHVRAESPRTHCFECAEVYPCPTRTKLSALLASGGGVTDEQAEALYRALFPGETRDCDEGLCTIDHGDIYISAGHQYAKRLAAAGLAPAAWLPEDERYEELRKAAWLLLSATPKADLGYAGRLRNALQAFDDEERER